MADFTHARHGPASVAPPEPVRTEEDLTHHRKGPLGDTAVVPDGYVGPMPPGAVRETEYQRMAAVYGNISSGKSSITFDTSNFLKAPDGKDMSLLEDPIQYMKKIGEAAAFKQQYMDYIQDLVKTPAGLQMLETLDQSKHKTRIEAAIGGGNSALADDWEATKPDSTGRPGPGTGSRVFADPTATQWESCNEQPPWMVDRPRFGFYHELVHAYHNNLGDVAGGGGSYVPCADIPHEIGNLEFQTAGIGPYASQAVSENSIRAQMGVPLRTSYSGATPGAPNPWAQKTDAEEPPLRSPHR